jgi:acetylornithine/succinyldiaminopimelate/putrescine aminotransferase
MTTTPETRNAEDEFLLDVYPKLPLTVVRGRGNRIYDERGREVLDLYAGHAVSLTGHGHPRVLDALRDQMDRLVFSSNAVYVPSRARAAELLAAAAPEGLRRIFFVNSGAEAIEAALKLARKHTGREKVVALEGGFHGRTLGALSITALGSYRSAWRTMPGGVVFAPFGDARAVLDAAGSDAAAVILEPIQSLGGVRMAADSFYRELAAELRGRGTLLIFDEIQTGLGRTGRMWFGDHCGVVPDLITLGKGLGSGVPVAAALVSEQVADGVKKGEHGTTFGGGPLACAAAAATLEVIRDEDLAGNAARVGEHLRRALRGIQRVKEVRGAGLLVGIVADGIKASELQARLLERGALTGTCNDPAVLRLLPPLTLTIEDVAHFVDLLADALRT